jgi:hypothetical protein
MEKLFSVIIFIFLLYSTNYGHGGRLDEYGGHFNRSTGEYHHHGGLGLDFTWIFIIVVVIVILKLLNNNKK